HRDELNAVIQRKFDKLDTDTVIQRLSEARVANGRVNTVQDFLEHPVLAARDRWRSVPSPGGDLAVLRPPVDIDGLEPALGPVPAVGEHTKAILRELGSTDEDIDALRAADTEGEETHTEPGRARHRRHRARLGRPRGQAGGARAGAHQHLSGRADRPD